MGKLAEIRITEAEQDERIYFDIDMDDCKTTNDLLKVISTLNKIQSSLRTIYCETLDIKVGGDYVRFSNKKNNNSD